MDIQWFPGHMTKAIRQMEEDVKLVDLIIEVIDARIPVSSRNPELDKIGKNKARVIIMNKFDLADEAVSRQWAKYFEEQGAGCVLMDSRNKKGISEVKKVIATSCAAKKARDAARGIKNRPVRAMVAGIPNCGKSTFINTYAGRSAAKTGDKPGVTKGKQWIRLGSDLELLDTPGILWPKFEDKEVGAHLAMIGSVNSDILDMGEVAYEIIEFLKKEYPGRVSERYGVDETHDSAGLLEEIAIAKGWIRKGAEADIGKCSQMIAGDFKSGRLGRISLDRPEQYRGEK
ncbi:ribosome biogenesis GTPase A [Lachnospiraceae bacterium XPB1003]|nr:ribosome biogenesis GTPase A [Lachnospiraceae bacterium XPB1003]